MLLWCAQQATPALGAGALAGGRALTDYAIRTDNLSRDFGRVRAVDHLGLEVPKGMIFGFLGPNGAGKTTTIHLLLGLLEPTDGRAQVLGFDTRTQADEVRSRTGALLEHEGLYERLSAEDNLEFYGRIWHMPAAARQARIQELLTHLELWDRRNEIVGTWSRGMKQKLAVARVIFHHPELIFLDEPTAGLDPIAAAALREDLAGLAAREGVTVFLTTHNLTEAERLCQQVGVIRQGRLLAVGSPDELRARQGTPRLEFLGQGFTENILSALRARPDVVKVEQQNHRLLVDLNGNVNAAPLVTLVVGAGAEVEEVHRGNASLEEVFLSLMEEEK
jgi:ABC-2 type transport system ATP-binding protein